MAEENLRWSVYEHPQQGFRAIQARYVDYKALLLGPVWALLNGLLVLGVGLLVMEMAAIAALYYWSKLFLVPLLWVHAYAGIGSCRLIGRSLKEDGWTYRGDVNAPTDITAAARVKSGQLEAKLEPLALDLVPGSIKPVFGIVSLTWQASMRYRVFWVMVAMLVLNVLILPLILKGDGSAKGMVNVLLTYTMAVVFLLLGATTLWLGCGSIAGDVAGCQMQLLTTKPIPRWQIWLGKWLGIMSFNAALLFLSGASIYGMVYYRVDSFADDRLAELRMKPGDEIEKMSRIVYDTAGVPRWFMRPWAQQKVHDWTVKLEEDMGLGSEERVKELAEMTPVKKYQAFKKAYEDSKQNGNSRMGPDWLAEELRKMLAEKEMELVKTQFLAGRASVKPDLSEVQKSLDEYAPTLFLRHVKENMPVVDPGIVGKQTLSITEVPDFCNRVTQVLSKHLENLQNNKVNFDPSKASFYSNGDVWWENTYDLAKVFTEQVAGNNKVDWVFHLPEVKYLPPLEPITLRFRLEGFVASPDEKRRETAQIAIQDNLYPFLVEFGDTAIEDRLTVRTYHDYFVYPSSFDDEGKLTVRFTNLGQVPLSIPFWKGDLELLYQESGFGVNFIRSMAIIFCWLGILGAMGLAMASFMDFPMASFACIGLLVISLFTGLMQEVVDDGGLRQTFSHGKRNTTWMDKPSLIAFKVLSTIISPLKDYSPITSLSEGRSVTWGNLGWAYLTVWGIGGGFFVLFGTFVFERRELALHGKE